MQVCGTSCTNLPSPSTPWDCNTRRHPGNMAAESSPEIEPSANGTSQAAALADSNPAAHTEVAAKDASQKASAAEKRRQRKKKNKQAKQLERQNSLYAVKAASSSCSSLVSSVDLQTDILHTAAGLSFWQSSSKRLQRHQPQRYYHATL